MRARSHAGANGYMLGWLKARRQTDAGDARESMLVESARNGRLTNALRFSLI
jgi:hypothetical protein